MARPTMLDYARMSPEAVASVVRRDCARPLADRFLAGDYRRVRIVACGSSRNASWIARPYLRQALGCEVLVTEPYTFVTYEHELPDDEFCFVVSQSGYSTNALAALATIRAAGRVAIGVTGDPASDFREAADVLVDYGVGEELVAYVTKGVTTLVAFLALFGMDVAEAQGRLDREAELAGLEGVMGQFRRTLDLTPGLLDRRYKELSTMGRTFLCGAGANLGIAMEGALKYGECLQIPTYAYELEEYLHGPNLQLSPLYTVFFVALGQRSWERTRDVVAATRLVSDHVFLVTDDPACDDADIRLDPQAPELLAPLAALPLFQATAWQLTEDEHLWHKHPLVARFDHALSGKSENYVDKEVL